jgi:hypothetical protein
MARRAQLSKPRLKVRLSRFGQFLMKSGHKFNDHLADIRKYGAFAFECHRNARPVTDTQQFQPSKVWQLKQGINEFLHQVFWDVFKTQVHKKYPGDDIRYMYYFRAKGATIRTGRRRRQSGSRADTRIVRTGYTCDLRLREGR